jgi:RNA polymerase sigma-B factor
MSLTASERRDEFIKYRQIRKSANPRLIQRQRDRLAAQNDRLALKIARRMLGCCKEELDDLSQLARVGLLKAIDRYDVDKGTAFSSFAVPYIKGEILHHLRDHWSLLKVPRRWLETLEKMERIQRKFEKAGRVMPLAEIAAAHGIAPDQWREIESAFGDATVVSLEEGLHDGEPDCDTARQSLRQVAIARAATLPNTMGRCVLMRLMHGAKDGAIAKALDLDTDTVRQLIADGLARLQAGQTEQI